MQGCDEEVAIVVVREEMRMDVEMTTGVKMAVIEGEEVLIDETMETVMMLAVECGSVAGGVSVTKVWYMRRIGCALGRIGDGAAS